MHDEAAAEVGRAAELAVNKLASAVLRDELHALFLTTSVSVKGRL